MSWIAAGTTAVSVGTSLLGGHSQRSAQRKALQAQEAAYGRQQSIMAPYSNAGTQALNGLAALSAGNYSGFESSPDYRYAKQEATSAVDNNAAARGMLYSGAHSVDLARKISGIASQNLGNYRSSLMNMAQMGQSAAGGMASAAGQFGSAAADNALAAGDTKAQTIGAIGSGLASLGGNLMTRMGTTGTGTTATGTTGTYAPSSLWGQQTAAGQGANLNFGNNLSGFYGWGS